MIIFYLVVVYVNTLPKNSEDKYRLFIKNDKLIPKGDMTFKRAYALNLTFFIDYFL